MKENADSGIWKSLSRVGTAIVAIGIAVSPAVHAKPKSEKMAGKHPDKIVLVRPTDLPELARQTGEAMFLYETGDGKMLLFVEQQRGTRLAIFDVTDPSNIRGEVSVQLDAPGPFDFVTPLGSRAELVRFRQSQGVAVLDLHKVKAPTMKMVQGLDLQALKERLGDDGFIFASQAAVRSVPNAQDYKVVETPNSQGTNRVFDVKGVREEITNDRTGTTFLLTADGLYLIRRPAVEEDYKVHENQMNQPG